ncbi:uncharacterized protein LOC143470550 [Clavelina lepadiformis]|uniref:uncharacterized protein LOC143470550 n=1 Tax=Clavelina lepadiformis TaxID=159417 RepID=UPI0040411D38
MKKKEATSILAGVAFKSTHDNVDAVTFALARAGKTKRQKHFLSDGDVLEKLVSAAIEISRIWRGYSCRKKCKKVFTHHQQSGQIKFKSDEDFTTQPVTKFEIERKSPALPDAKHSNESFHFHEEVLSQDGKSEVSDTQVQRQDTPPKFREVIKVTSAKSVAPEQIRDAQPKSKKVFKTKSGKSDAATVIQRAWRRHIDMQVFRYYRDLINFRGQGDPALMLRCINPNEAKLLDAASGIHVRFRLAGEKFPPNIYYKIYTHRHIVDMCANSPKDYTKPGTKTATAKQTHTRNLPMHSYTEADGWYERYENNGWRLVSDRLIYASMDPVTWESSRKKVQFHHVKLQRKTDVEHRRRQRKIEWMKKMYKEGMLKARENDSDTTELVQKAARGLVNTVNTQGSEAVMDWEVDELLQWTTALNFDDYLEVWKESATSNVSEIDVANIPHSRNPLFSGEHPNGATAVNFDPYSLTRSSSIGMRQPQHKGIPLLSGSQRGESRVVRREETQLGRNRGVVSEESVFMGGSRDLIEATAR